MIMIGAPTPHATSKPMMGLEVTLDELEVLNGTELGQRRHAAALAQGRTDAHDYDGGEPEEIHIAGALGELACAKALDIPFAATINTFKAPDVGPYQVRTRSGLYDELLIRPNAVNSEVYIMVRGRCPHYHIVGWILAGDAKRPDWYKNHGGRAYAYFVPDTYLSEMALLI